jgi:protein-disulfide isomerase
MKAGRWQAGAGWAAGITFDVTIMALMAIALVLLVASVPAEVAAAAAAAANPVVATVGAHKITQSDLDAQVLATMRPNDLYSLRKQALDSMVNSYLIDQAAKKAKMTPEAYLEHELEGPGSQVTAADAQKYYDTHKAGIDAQTGGRPYKEIQPLLIAAMQRHQIRAEHELLMAKLRTASAVTVSLEAPRVDVPSAGHPWTGGKHASVTIVEFSDFQCPYCRAAEPTLKQVRDKYGDQIKLVYMDFPLPMHQHSMDAANAGRCAGDQGKFWQFHDAMFADQGKLDPASLKSTATKAGLDSKKFDACFDSKKMVPAVKADQAVGSGVGVNGTPTFFINGREVVGAESVQSFSEIIDDELAHAKPNSAQANAAAAEPQAKAN